MNPDHDPETELLLAAQRGEAAKFAELIEKTRPRLTRQLLGCDLTRAIGEDLPDALADGVLQAWRFLAAYRADRCPAYGWLWVLTRNAAIDILRRRSRWRTNGLGGA